jgi:hypothetical protein
MENRNAAGGRRFFVHSRDRGSLRKTLRSQRALRLSLDDGLGKWMQSIADWAEV